MSCEHLTGLQRVWCEVTEAFRTGFGILSDDQAAELARVQSGGKDEQARVDAVNFFTVHLRPRMVEMNVPPEIISVMEEVGEMEFPSNVLFGGMVYLSYLQSTLRGYLGIASLPVQYELAGVLGVARPDPSTAWAMSWRGWPDATRKSMLRDLGWTPDLIALFGEISRPRLAAGDLFRHMHLTSSGAADAYNELARRGYTAEDTAAMSVLSRFIPGPGDLVSMAVREAWRDDVAAKWGYDRDRPDEFLEWMHRQGDVDGWAERYWRAHWELPGITMAMEMLHRVPAFGIEEFRELLRISDIPATFRDHISEIAYVPLTRVDVRRMYGLGVLSRDEVKRNYLDLGYNDRDAERMTEFTIRFETDEDREATKTDILSFYTVGALTAAEAVSWLREIGYPSDLAQYLVARETMKAEQKYVNEQVKYIKNMYVHREIDVASARTQMGALGLTAGEIGKLLDTWDIAREAKIERPSRATLDRLFKQDVITQGDYYEGLHALGYQDRYKDWYVDSVLRQKTEDTRKEEEAARKEQDEIRKRKVKSDYQITKAGLDVDVAELQTAIAETQLALRERKSRYEEESRIAREALTIVQLEEQAAADIADLAMQIDGLQEAIAFLDEQIEAFQTEIAEIKLDQALETPLYAPEAAVLMIRDRQVIIERAQDDVAAAGIQIAQLRSNIGARREQLRRDIGIVERIRDIEEVEADYRDDLATMTARLARLRFNLTELREQKAMLTVEYRVGIAPVE